MSELNGVLAITQTPENLTAIRRLLDGLHRSISTNDFPLIPTTSPSAGNSRRAPASTQPVTECFNIRPLVDELRMRKGSTTSQAASTQTAVDANPIFNIVPLLTDSIDPASWNDEASDTRDRPGMISEINGILVVTQSPENLQAVRRALEKLHEGLRAKNRRSGPTSGP